MSAKEIMVAAIILNEDGTPRSQTTGALGVDPKYPDKWVVSIINQYIVFSSDEVHEIKQDRIHLRLKGQRRP